MDIDSMTLAQLKTYASTHSISITGLTARKDVLEVINDALETEKYTVNDIEEIKKQLSTSVAGIMVFLRKTALRNRRFARGGDSFGGKVLANPVDHSLDFLEKAGYSVVPQPVLSYSYPLCWPGDDSIPSERCDYDDYFSELNRELDDIKMAIDENYFFQIPPEVFDGAVTLDNFLELSDAKREGNVVWMNENSVVLDSGTSKKNSIAVGKHTLRFVFCGGEWLVSAD
jgi:hypothetical protein